MPAKVFIPQEIYQYVAKVKHGQDAVISVRELLKIFGGSNRKPRTVNKIRKAFRKLQLTTSPDYKSVSLNESVAIVKQKKRMHAVLEQLREPLVTFGMLQCVERQRKERLKYGQDGLREVVVLAEKSNEWSVTPKDTVEKAILLLCKPGIDFLPVFNTPENVLGVISWDDFGIKSLTTKNSRLFKCESIMKPPVTVSETASVYDFKQEIVSKGYVIILNQNNIAYAVVRSSDLAAELLRMTEGFLLLREIELIIRNIIDYLNFNQTDFDSCLPSDKRGKNWTTDDLEFSHYIGFFGTEVVKKKMEKRGIPRVMTERIQRQLSSIREIRNGIVHFHPDENNEAAANELKGARKYLESLYKEIVPDDELA